MTKQRLLVTGASGLLGQAICRQALPTWEVFGVCHTGTVNFQGVSPIKTDLTDSAQLADCFKTIAPTAVIHAAALSQPNDCQLNPEESKKVNLQATVDIAGQCVSAGIPLVFTSTDLVFSGQEPPYTEDDPVSPVCTYGLHKSAAEQALQVICPMATICRMPLMLGYASETGSGFMGQMVKALREERELKLFTDEFRTPVDTDSAAIGLLMALENPGALMHLGGRQRMSRFSMGCLVADVLKADHDLLKPLRIPDLPMPAPRSPDVSLSSERAFELGYAPANLVDVIKEIVAGIE